jgi:LemA protein
MGDLILILVVLFVLPGIAVVLSYNRFVAQIASIDATWAGIDVELQRRHDLVDNLVRTVEGYADHERTTLDAVTAARSRAIQATSSTVPVEDQARAEDALTDGLSRLLAITEDFPDLKADRAFRDLQQQLVETEDRITSARRLYNLEVAAYERRRRSIPSNLVAGLFSFAPRDLFEIQDAGAKHAAQVSW